MRLVPTGFWASLALTLSPVILLAGPFDWPQWRGDARDGICKETGLLSSWPKEGPPLVWKTAGLGGGYTTPAIADGRILGMSYQGEEEVLWAREEKTGKELWKTKIASKGKVGHNEGSRCTPTVDGGVLYAVGLSGDLVCLNVQDGKTVWTKNYAKDFKGRMMSGWGFSESPLVDGDKLICTPGGDDAAVVALDKKTGNLLWSAKVPQGGGAGYASLVISEAGGIRQYITWLGKNIIGVSAKEGKLLWRYAGNANSTANIPTAIVKNDLVLSSTGYGGGATSLLRLQADGKGGIEAKEVYKVTGEDPRNKIQNHHGGMVLLGDYAFFGMGHNNGIPCCLELLTGKLVWKEEKRPGSGSAAMLYADGKLYFRNQDGTMNLLEASPKGYNLISSFKLPEPSGKPSWPHPVIANGRLYIRDQDKLFCFSVKAAQ
ncbi:MAG: polyvinylalcohol dehydrogenase [Gemmataceae bacterium]|nr:polyvinylalcohol dehydrogenase [Gemmataceae bacterium]